MLVYVACHDDATQTAAEARYADVEWARVLRAAGPGARAAALALEARRAEWENEDYVGVIGWDADDVIVADGLPRVAETMEGHDVVAVLPALEHPVVVAATSCPDFLEAWLPLVRSLGYDVVDGVRATLPAFYRNYFLARPGIMSRYLDAVYCAGSVLDARCKGEDALSPAARELALEMLPCLFFAAEKASLALISLGRAAYWEATFDARLQELEDRRGDCRSRLNWH